MQTSLPPTSTVVNCGDTGGETLVFDAHVTRGADEGTNTVRYTLAADGRSFVAEEHFRSTALNYDNRWVLDRVEPG